MARSVTLGGRAILVWTRAASFCVAVWPDRDRQSDLREFAIKQLCVARAPPSKAVPRDRPCVEYQMAGAVTNFGESAKLCLPSSPVLDAKKICLCSSRISSPSSLAAVDLAPPLLFRKRLPEREKARHRGTCLLLRGRDRLSNEISIFSGV
jgi:hypothetical protein